MLNSFFSGLYSATGDPITLSVFFFLLVSSLLLGAVYALAYYKCNLCTKSLAVTLATLPAIVSTVIMMVNGSVGAGVAVAGAFSLVRFRSAPGSAKEIAAVFIAMVIGLTCGMGCPGLSALFTGIMCLVDLLYSKVKLKGLSDCDMKKTLQITVPENLEFANMFDDLFEEYTTEARLKRVKTANLGSLNRLSYDITLRRACSEKALIDSIRCRNGNLEVTLMERTTENIEL